jgi:hypothetical protein
MFDAIKTLSRKQRLFGFVIAIVLTSITAIFTAYYKDDNCKPISDQYIELSRNHSNLMKINNHLNSDYDILFNDMIKVNAEVRTLKHILDSIQYDRKNMLVKSNLRLEKTSSTKPILDSIILIMNKYDSCDVKP